MRNMTKKKEKPAQPQDNLKLQYKIITKLSELQTQGGVTHVDLGKLASSSDCLDEKELMRALFILEGHKLVAPNPAGDFTSRYWGLTVQGFALVKNAAAKIAA